MAKSKYKAIKVNGVKHDYHRWLMEQELGRRLNSNEIVHHENENKLDNDISNLKVMTRSEHARMHAKPPYFTDYARERAREAAIGRPSPSRKLTDEDARFIREHYIPKDKKYGARALSLRYGVSHQIILCIINGERYKNA